MWVHLFITMPLCACLPCPAAPACHCNMSLHYIWFLAFLHGWFPVALPSLPPLLPSLPYLYSLPPSHVVCATFSPPAFPSFAFVLCPYSFLFPYPHLPLRTHYYLTGSCTFTCYKHCLFLPLPVPSFQFYHYTCLPCASRHFYFSLVGYDVMVLGLFSYYSPLTLPSTGSCCCPFVLLWFLVSLLCLLHSIAPTSSIC